MKQARYIGNTTESLLQHGRVFARFSFLLFLSLCSCMSLGCPLHSRFLSICAGVEVRSSFSCLCCTGALTVRRGWRKMYNRRTEDNMWQLANKSVLVRRGPTFPHESTVLGKAFAGFFEAIQGEKKPTLD